MSFYAIHKITQARVNALAVEFSEEFFKVEEWFADPLDIEACPKEIDITKIESRYRRLSKEIISYKGKVYYKRPHFYVPDSEKLGITVRPNLEEHTKAVTFVYNILKNNMVTVVSSVNKPNEYTNELILDYSLFDLSKLSVEVSITDRRTKRVDILMPFKKYHESLCFGIAFEIQLSPQSDNKELERSIVLAEMGFSVAWLKPKDFKDIKDEILQLEDTKLRVDSVGIIRKRYKEHSERYIQEMTINYSKMLDDKMRELESIVNKIRKPIMAKCPKCKGILTLKRGSYGEFYGCSNYPSCKFNARVP